MPWRTQNNGTLDAYIVLSRNKNFKDESSSFHLSPRSLTVVKEISLTKYKLNDTQKYINLLESKSKSKEQSSNIDEKKILTHLIKKFTIFTMDSQIDFDRFHLPQELIYDIS